eukprot:3860749-Amphidinium_carterae.1
MVPDEITMQESGISSMDFHSMLGRTELVIQLVNTMPIGVHSKRSLFLDQSIVLWCEGVMPGALYQWMMNNGLGAIVKEFFIN